MNVGCENCSARYAIPDQKVKGRRVRITCKRCGKAIVVDGTALAVGAEAQTVSEVPVSVGEPQVGSGQQPVAGRGGEPASGSSPQVGRPPTAGVPRPGVPRPGKPRPAPPAFGKKSLDAPPPSGQWEVELSPTQREHMTTPEVVELYARGNLDSTTRIRATGSDEWKSPFQHSLIADALRQRGFASGAEHLLPKLQTDGDDDESDVHGAATINVGAEELWRAAGVDKQALRRKWGGKQPPPEEDEVGEDDETSVIPSSRFHPAPTPPEDSSEEGLPVAPGAQPEPGDDDLTLLYKGGKTPPGRQVPPGPAPPAVVPAPPAVAPAPPAASSLDEPTESEQHEVDDLLGPPATEALAPAPMPPPAALPAAPQPMPVPSAPFPPSAPLPASAEQPLPEERAGGSGGAWLVALVAFLVALLGVAAIVYVLAPQLFAL